MLLHMGILRPAQVASPLGIWLNTSRAILIREDTMEELYPDPAIQRLAHTLQDALVRGGRIEKQRLQALEADTNRQELARTDPELSQFVEGNLREDIARHLLNITIAYAAAGAIHSALEDHVRTFHS